MTTRQLDCSIVPVERVPFLTISSTLKQYINVRKTVLFSISWNITLLRFEYVLVHN